MRLTGKDRGERLHGLQLCSLILRADAFIPHVTEQLHCPICTFVEFDLLSSLFIARVRMRITAHCIASQKCL